MSIQLTSFFLKSSVAIDLKMGEFGASYKGTGKNEEHIELMPLDKSNLKVAEYLTILTKKSAVTRKIAQSD